MKDSVPENIKSLKPYTSARDLANDHIRVFLDANENPFDSALNRYPDPMQKELTQRISEVKRLKSENILLTNGSDEAIDVLIKAFCESGKDKALIFPPTYGIYQVRTQINNVRIVESPLLENFQVNAPEVSRLIKDPNLKLIFICSPNNPTGHVFNDSWIMALAKKFHGVIVVDEAYIDFSDKESLTRYPSDNSNIVVLQTLSKAWGMASARIGLTVADKDIISILRGIKLPYNISGTLQKEVIEILDRPQKIYDNIDQLVQFRENLKEELLKIKGVELVYPSEANFLLFKVNQADFLFEGLVDKGIQIRNFSTKIPGCLRITIGTKKENKLIVESIKELLK